MTTSNELKILLVDDDESLLMSLRRQLEDSFTVVTAVGGAQGLILLADDGPFAVCVSDMRMPGMDGVEFLKKLEAVAPDTIRIMLTGNIDQKTSTQAINEGHVFRFLNKPISSEELAKVIEAGIKQYKLVTAEKQLLQETLGGVVRVLTEALTTIDPDGFQISMQARMLVKYLCQRLKVTNSWEILLACMLQGLGRALLPVSIKDKQRSGASLTPDEFKLVTGHHNTGADLLAYIPRLEGVADLVRSLGGPAQKEVNAKTLGSAIIRIATEYAALSAKGLSVPEIISVIRAKAIPYPPAVVAALEAEYSSALIGVPIKKQISTISELIIGDILASSVFASDGTLLISAGLEVTTSLLKRLESYAAVTGILLPLEIRR